MRARTINQGGKTTEPPPTTTEQTTELAKQTRLKTTTTTLGNTGGTTLVRLLLLLLLLLLPVQMPALARPRVGVRLGTLDGKKTKTKKQQTPVIPDRIGWLLVPPQSFWRPSERTRHDHSTQHGSKQTNKHTANDKPNRVTFA